jgi:hypothetical protein
VEFGYSHGKLLRPTSNDALPDYWAGAVLGGFSFSSGSFCVSA